MKKIILIIAMVALGGLFYNSSNAQCTFSGLGVKVNSSYTDPVTNKCVVNIDLYFDIDHNAGGKYFWIHIWPTSLYPAAFDYHKPPTTSLIPGGNGALDGSLTSFGYYHFQGALEPMLAYPPDANVPNFQSSYTLTEIPGTPDRYTAHGLTITLPQSCDIPQSLTADAWESQSADAQNVACVSRGQQFFVNDPKITGFLQCATPRKYNFDIYTLSTTSRTVNYEVRIDNGDGVYNASLDTMLINSGSTSINSTSPYHSGLIGYPPYDNTKPYADKDLWVIVLKNATDQPNDLYYHLINACIPLPVQFASFTALRNKENVILKWVTATELNNKGFYVERKSGNGEWQVMGYIASQAANGNSNENLFYNYTDFNNLKAVSQYRIRQVDLDNKASYSDIRLVKGLEQTGNVVVFPNPSPDGQLNIVLDNIEGGATIRLIDMNGRVVKEWINVTTNKLNINYVSSGMYTLRVWMKGTNEPLNVKVMVSK